MRLRMLAVVTALILVSAACGNSKKNSASSTTTPAGVSQTTTADIDKKVPVEAPGVTDDAITVNVITAKTNPLHGKYAELADGVQAYFNMINEEGGIYGRELKIGKQRDDIAGLQNREQIQQGLSSDNAFATFIATLQFTGADLLQKAGQPTFGWNINGEYGDKNALFGNSAALCNSKNCIGMFGSWLAKKAGATKVAVLAYGVAQQSIDCGEGTVASFENYGTSEVVFKDFTIGFAQADLSAQVAQMKAKGAQMVFTCMDTDETLVLAKEMKKQGLNAIQSLPNGYNAPFIAANKQYYEGSYVVPQFTALEWQPKLPEIQLFEKWVAASNKTIYETTVIGWIAAYQFVLGLKLAGPEFSQAKVISALNTQTNVNVGGLIPSIDWTTGHIDPVKHPEAREKIACANFLIIRSGQFVPVFGTSETPYVCLDNTSKTVPDEPELRNFED